ncbi:MAG: DUF3273 domain-containing protein [Myxococcota bacterium]|jgi:MtN3 and saliva related transmembrane protein|nr:DUF3273 domain-containing protein [Myxococcota bacterium]
MATELVGWTSSLVLLLTILTQIGKQWRERSARGVSSWLFFGQIAASIGFTIYSWLVHNWVFVVTNALMLVSAIVGAVMTARFRRHGNRAAAA